MTSTFAAQSPDSARKKRRTFIRVALLIDIFIIATVIILLVHRH